MRFWLPWTMIAALMTVSCQSTNDYAVLIRGGTVYDGLGNAPIVTDVAIAGDTIAAMGNLEGATADKVIDATDLAVAPGFINMLSWATESLIIDGRSQGDLLQGVTLEVFGEGKSPGPMNEAMKQVWLDRFSRYVGSDEEVSRLLDSDQVPWTTLSEYLEFLEAKGVSTNIASFVGATSVRIHELGYEDRKPSPKELERMIALVTEAMKDGALGLGSSLIYAPAFYAETDELIALSAEAARFGGMYISHLRSEGNRLIEALDELLTIAEEANIAAEIYHLKMSGEENWSKIEDVVERIEAAQAKGLRITANMYTYTAGATGLNAAMPPWVQEGGYEAWSERLQDSETRNRVEREMLERSDHWENLLSAAGSEGTLLTRFLNPDLKKYTGWTLAEVAAERGTSPQQTAMDLVIEEGSRVGVVYFLMSEQNVKRLIALPWISFGSDAASMAPEPPFNHFGTHPRAYGNFARLLGKYVREESVISLEEAIRRLTSLPAGNLGIKRRGSLTPGFFADIVVFNPDGIVDHATYKDSHRFSSGVMHVLVNGQPVIKEGEHTGATPGRVVRGPGWTGGDL